MSKLAFARQENRPILLSIGYSACHWCHVMAHESFEDAAVAAVMNRLFVNIKVDREERPDLDQIYQTAHQMLTERHGGWPLTMFLAPYGTPFFGGTYFPREPRYGLPGFTELCEKVAEAFQNRRADIETQNAELRRALAGTTPTAAASGGLDADAGSVKALAALSIPPRANPTPISHPIWLSSAPRRYGPAPDGADHADAQAEAASTNRSAAALSLAWMIKSAFRKCSTTTAHCYPAPTLGARQRSAYARVADQTANWYARNASGRGWLLLRADADSEGEEGKTLGGEIRRLLSPRCAGVRRWSTAAEFEGRHCFARVAAWPPTTAAAGAARGCLRARAAIPRPRRRLSS